MREGRRRDLQRARILADHDAGALRRQPLVHDPPILFTVGVAEDDDAVSVDPFGENREVADGQRVGPAAGLPPGEQQERAIATQI